VHARTHTHKPVCEDDVTILWNQGVYADREVNRPDIIINNKKDKTCILIDLAIPVDRNVVQKEAEKKLKYKSLCILIQPMWNMNCTIIPVTTGATRTATKGLKKMFETIPGKHLTDTLNKTATCTRNITHNTEILQSETEARAVGITVCSREVPGRKGLSQET
jgi:hypothetical protein